MLFVILLVLSNGKAANESFEHAKLNVKMRMIGDEILRYAGDSTSRVLPVKELPGHAYEI